MKNGRLFLGGLAGFVGLALGTAGCGGDDHHCFDCERQSFTGAYQGSGINSTGIFSITLNIDNNDNISGTQTQLTGGSGTSTIAGSVDNRGNASITLTPAAGGAVTETGSMAFVAQGVIQVAFSPSGSNTQIPVTLGLANSGIWDGNYTGTYAASGGTTGTVSVRIDASGNVTGTATPATGAASTLSGTVNPAGVASLTVTPATGPAVTYTGGAAYNLSDQLQFTTANGANSFSMTLTFVSNAARHPFPLRP